MQWDDDPELADIGPQSIYKVVRALKKDDHGAYNCLASVVADASFVRDVCARYPNLPVFANLRCGLWYVDPETRGRRTRTGDDDDDDDRGARSDASLAASDAVGTCYFKSTDGHCNNWSFSATRLNLHVAEAAATSGGCVVVDATRSSTKRFPDSLSKTIPVWAETLSRAVARRRGEPIDDRIDWRAGPHLPVWVGDNERNSIAALMPAFEETLEGVFGDGAPDDALASLAAKLAKPLRCVWASRENATSPPCLGVGGRSEWDGDFVPLVLVTASEPMARHGERRSGADGAPYAYVPGAGDDEESWSRGLTPSVFWQNSTEILHAGPRGCAAVVDRVVMRTHSLGGNEGHERARVTNKGGLGYEPAGGGDDSSRLAPKGCAEVGARTAPPGETPLRAGGVRLLDAFGVSLALGSAAALTTEAAWERVDAVLYVGEDTPPLPPGWANEESLREPVSEKTSEDSQRAKAPRGYPKPFKHVPMRYAKAARRDVADGLDACLEFIRSNARGRTLVACKDGVDHCCGVATAALVDASMSGEEAGAVSKEEVRRRLADVARAHPECRPSRGTLKQVFNRMFEMRR